jgi:O-acetyl-ADP-ribose deacetylase (regulator of RNase III)
MRLLREHRLRSVAFPSISTGAYGYPLAEACVIAVATVREEVERYGQCEQVVFCTYGEQDYDVYGEVCVPLSGEP